MTRGQMGMRRSDESRTKTMFRAQKGEIPCKWYEDKSYENSKRLVTILRSQFIKRKKIHEAIRTYACLSLPRIEFNFFNQW